MPDSRESSDWLPTLTVSGGKVRFNISDLEPYGLVAAEASATTGDIRKIVWALCQLVVEGKESGMPVGMNIKESTSYRENVIRTYAWDFTTEYSVSEVVPEDLKAPPFITVNPAETVEIEAGEDLELEVSATGATGYQWFFNGAAIVGQTNATLSIPGVDSSHAGSYRVQVRNSYGAVVSTPSTVAVLNPPVITTHPADLFIEAEIGTSGTGELSVVATGTEPLSYQWQRSATDPGIGATWVNISGSTSILSITRTFGDPTVWYRCVVTNAYGSANSNAAEVEVNDEADPAVIIASPASQYRIVAYDDPADPVDLEVVAAGSGALTYQWKKAPINQGSASLTTSKNLTIAGTPTYPVEQALLFHSHPNLFIINDWGLNIYQVDLVTGTIPAAIASIDTSVETNWSNNQMVHRFPVKFSGGDMVVMDAGGTNNFSAVPGSAGDLRRRKMLCLSAAGVVTYRAGRADPTTMYLVSGSYHGYSGIAAMPDNNNGVWVAVADVTNNAGGAGFLPRFQHYNYTTDTWTTAASSLPDRYLRSAHMRADGKILCFTLPFFHVISSGTNSPAIGASDLHAYLFDPVGDTVTDLGPVGFSVVPASTRTILLPNGDMVLPSAQYTVSGVETYGKTCLYYHAATNTFEQTEDLSVSRFITSSYTGSANNIAHRNAVGVFPGTGEGFICGQDVLEVFSTESMSWRTSPVNPAAGSRTTFALSDGRILTAGQIISSVQYEWTNQIRFLSRVAGAYSNVGTNSNELTVNVDQATQDALYKCAVSNLAGAATSNPALLIVDVSPAFSSGATRPLLTAGATTGNNITVTGTTSVTVALAGVGDAPLTYLWERSFDGGATWITHGAVVPSFVFSATKLGGVTTYHDFKLTVTNAYGSKTSLISTITVL